ncbi:TPA: restriction endonuclease subunit S [Photobacterium damselae]
MTVESLITQHIDTWTSAVKTKSTTGRGSSKKLELYGVKKLRELILELAVRGKLVPQDPNDEPASVLFYKIQDYLCKKVNKKSVPIIKRDKSVIEPSTFHYNLPINWEWCELQELVLFLNGKAHEQFITEEKEFVLINSKFVSTGGLVRKYASERLTPLKSLDIAMVMSDVPNGKALARCYLVKKENYYTLNQRICGLSSSPDLSMQYLMIVLNRNKYLLSYNDGKKQTNLKKVQVMSCPIPLPPKEEQHRIVDKVDELMALCDQLEQQTEASIEAHQLLVSTLLNTLTHSTDADELMENWARVSDHFDTLFTTEESIEQLKQTILQLAVMGKLVPQDPSDEPASVLLERIAEEKAQLIKEKKIKKQKALPPIADDEKPFELPKGWEWCRVQDVAQFTTSGSRDWAKYYSDSGALFVTMGNLSRGSYELRMDNLRYVQPPKGGEGSRTKLEAYDLLISITGDVGNLGLIPEDFGEAYINQHTCLLRFVTECQDQYFPELMRSPFAKEQFDAPQRGIKNSFRLSDVGEMLLPLPPREERLRITQKVGELMAVCDQIKCRIECSKTTQLHLTDAIVEQAV